MLNKYPALAKPLAIRSNPVARNVFIRVKKVLASPSFTDLSFLSGLNTLGLSSGFEF